MECLLHTGEQDDEKKKRGLDRVVPLLLPSVSVCFMELPVLLVLGQSTQKLTTSVSVAATRRRAWEEFATFSGRQLAFLIMMVVYLVSGFTAPFFIKRHPLSKE